MKLTKSWKRCLEDALKDYDDKSDQLLDMAPARIRANGDTRLEDLAPLLMLTWKGTRPSTSQARLLVLSDEKARRHTRLVVAAREVDRALWIVAGDEG